MRILSAILVLSVLVCLGCASAPVQAKQSSSTFAQTGKASYYADKYQGRSTASGEPYDKKAMTGAHRKLAFGTRVRVTNTQNGKSVIVRINDRGPFTKGRIIDLSRAAFNAIGNTAAGVLPVSIEVVN